MIELTAVRRAGNRIEEHGLHVDPIVRRAAELTAELVCRELGIKTVRVRWLQPERKDIRGQVLPINLTEIWVKVGQTVAGTIDTTAHECRHAWQLQPDQYRWAFKGLQTHEEREQDASAYGISIRRELTGS